MKSSLVKVICLMAAFCCTASADAGVSGGVPRPSSIPTGNIHQGYHPLAGNFYSSFYHVELRTAVNDYDLISPIKFADSSPSPIVTVPASTQGVPEPSTAALGIVAAACITALRRRRRG